jgi:uncharacterized membrane protein YbhN (UPF0104 family)
MKWLWVVVALSVTGLVAWLAVRSDELSGALETAVKLDWRIILPALLAILLSSLVESWRWKLLLPGETVSIPKLFLVKNAGMSLNNVSPIRLLAEPAQAVMLKFGHGVPTEKVVASMALAHLLELSIKAALIGIGLLFLPQLGPFVPFTLILLAIGTLGIAGIFLLRKGIAGIPVLRRLKRADSICKGMGVIWTNRRLGVTCLALTAFSWLLIGATTWMVARSVGIDLPFWLMPMLMKAILTFSSVIPGPPGAIGVYEASTVYVLTQFSVEPQTALAFAIISHAVLFLPSMLIGVPALAFNSRTTAQIFAASERVLGLRPKLPAPL